jgi:hypothetical protein
MSKVGAEWTGLSGLVELCSVRMTVLDIEEVMFIAHQVADQADRLKTILLVGLAAEPGGDRRLP